MFRSPIPDKYKAVTGIISGEHTFFNIEATLPLCLPLHQEILRVLASPLHQALPVNGKTEHAGAMAKGLLAMI